MLRRFFDIPLSLSEKGKPLHFLRPLIVAIDNFCYEPAINATSPPFIRDATDVKRWMMIVIFALLPTIFMAIWNTGVQKMVYLSGDPLFMKEYLAASTSLGGYFSFMGKDYHWLTALLEGAGAFLPVMLISYLVGGAVETIFACVRRKEIAEGFLVTGMLYPLILPPTLPYWMVAVGVALGVTLSKELFGGTGMNILNPALTSRAFLFFCFPGKMTGDVWVGTNTSETAASLQQMNEAAGLTEVDAYTQASPLGTLSAAVPEIKRIHVDAVATNVLGKKVATYDLIQAQFDKWNSSDATLGNLSMDQMHSFLTTPLESGGLGLPSGNFVAAEQFTQTSYGLGKFSTANLFFGNMVGSMGETSTLACLLGLIFLIYTGVGAWRTMVAFGLSAFLTAFLFQFISTHFGVDGGAWNPAKFAMPAYRHLLMGGLAFGLVYMATDPVSSPNLNLGKWIYGGLIGIVTILIRLINPAFPEGVMLAILFGNVFAPLIDYYSVRHYRKRSYG